MAVFSYRLSSRQRPITVEGYRDRARRALPGMIWAYVDHGAETETTMRANRDAFAQYALRSRVLTGRVPADLKTTVAGRELSLPVLLAPTGLTGLSHWSGELGAARAAERAGTVAIVSTASTYTLEEIAQGTGEDHFFQLYPCSDASGLQDPTLGLMRRAQDAGYSALFVTVDVQALGNREYERLRGMGNPPVLTPARVLDALGHPRWCYRFVRDKRVSARNLVAAGGARAAVKSLTAHARIINPHMNWDDIRWMRDKWQGRFYIKGILDAEDAERAVAIGADGVVVSNHGGRQLDHALASLHALPAISAAIGDRGEVILDGGVRRGSDVVKALCLGASAVCIGRPYLYGLAADGPAGVEAVLRIFREEISRTLTLMGVPSLADLNSGWLIPAVPDRLKDRDQISAGG
jgi:L-lactate dehydrogenase (cytochrome)/(S)-mandelate dehydrogenase